MRESTLVRKIMMAVRKRCPHTFVVKLADRCTRGLPDLLIVWRGDFLFVETKSEIGRLSVVQRQVHRKIAAAGGIVLVARTVEDVMTCLERT